MLFKLKKGFYTALGTPLDENGKLLPESYEKQINMQIEAGTAGLLALGSMGAQAGIMQEEYIAAAKTAAKAVGGRVPLFCGAMDNSVWRVLDRISSISKFDIDGIFITTPFYKISANSALIRFFQQVADNSPLPIYLYDLQIVTKQKITYDMVTTLAEHPNIAGIKTGDIVLQRKLLQSHADFIAFFSNLDTLDVANAFGASHVIDGMFACTPKNSAAFSECFIKNDFKNAGQYLNKILSLRDAFSENGRYSGFTIAMNLLGCEGIYGYGYDNIPLQGEAGKVKEKLIEIGELK